MPNDDNFDILKEVDIHTDKQVEIFKQEMYKYAMSYNYEKDEFIAKLNLKWGNGFAALDTMYIFIIDQAKKYVEKKEITLNTGIKGLISDKKFFAIMNIHARACKVFYEILCLLKNGCADGAFAHWRTLFELSVYANFIFINNDCTADAYINQADTDTRNAD